MRTKSSADSETDFDVHAGYRTTGSRRFMGTLRVVRKTDGRFLYPFEGAPEIGPFDRAPQARDAAEDYGRELIAADLRNPEP